MPITDIEKFYQEHAGEDGILPEEDMAKMLVGYYDTDDTAEPPYAVEVEGADFPAEETEEKESQETSEDTEVEAEEEEKEPVVMAKDGKHTIPYSELENAREAVKSSKAEVETLKTEAETLKQQLEELQGKTDVAEQLKEAQAIDAETGKTDEVDKLLSDLRDTDPELAEIFDKRDMSHREQIRALEGKIEGLTKTITDKLAPFESSMEDMAEDSHFKAITDAHSDFDQIIDSGELERFVNTVPSFMRGEYQRVFANGTSQEVIDLVQSYKDIKGIATPSSETGKVPSKEEAEKIIADAEEKASGKTPTSLSEVPAGSNAHHDPAEAMHNMSSMKLLQMFEGKTIEQIHDLMNRAL